MKQIKNMLYNMFLSLINYRIKIKCVKKCIKKNPELRECSNGVGGCAGGWGGWAHSEGELARLVSVANRPQTGDRSVWPARPQG